MDRNKKMNAASEFSTVQSLRSPRKWQSPLAYLLIFVSLVFIGILIFCYVVTKRANPVFLDAHGKPVAENSENSKH
jgi:cytoskeletal protein RodZ